VDGSFAIPLHVDVIQAMSVHSVPDTAEYGGFRRLDGKRNRNATDAWNQAALISFPGFEGGRADNRRIADYPRELCVSAELVNGRKLISL